MISSNVKPTHSATACQRRNTALMIIQPSGFGEKHAKSHEESQLTADQSIHAYIYRQYQYPCIYSDDGFDAIKLSSLCAVMYF